MAYFKRARRDDFECSHHKEIINASGDRWWILITLIITPFILVRKHCIIPCKYVKLLCDNQKWNKKFKKGNISTCKGNYKKASVLQCSLSYTEV